MSKSLLARLMAMATMLYVGIILADEIRVGTSTVLSGPAQALGRDMKLGMEAYFNKLNKAGGVLGKKIKLIALDDGYEPNKAAPNMRQLIDQQNVVAVLGNVGTPTAIVTVPIANEQKTLLFGAFTGAGVLRKTPPDRYVINYRASYAEETAAMIGGLLGAGIKPEQIAMFTQNDGYGDSGYQGAVAALKAKGYADADKLAHGRYERNTLNIENGLSTVLDAKVEPRAIIMVGAYAPCAKFIKLARKDLPQARFLNVSFVGSNALAKELGADGEGVIVTQVVPHYDHEFPTVVEYREALKAFDAEAQPGFVSLEGYIVAKLFTEGLKKAGANPSRESIINALESLENVDLGIGTPVSLGKQKHQGSQTVWPTQIRNGKFVPMPWDQLKG